MGMSWMQVLFKEYHSGHCNEQNEQKGFLIAFYGALKLSGKCLCPGRC